MIYEILSEILKCLLKKMKESIDKKRINNIQIILVILK